MLYDSETAKTKQNIDRDIGELVLPSGELARPDGQMNPRLLSAPLLKV